MTKKIISILLLLIWLLLIFCGSNENGEESSSLSESITIKVCAILNIPDDNFDTVHFIVRKCAHFFEYFVLGLLTMNVLYNFKLINKITITASIICIVCALLDEYHQTFISGRSGNIVDSMLDSSSSMIASYLYARFKIFKS